MDKKYCVYMHTCPNGKVYIGITKQNPVKRWKGGSGYKDNKHFYAAILLYGWNNIKHEILYDNLKQQDACNMEIELISKYKSNEREFGYNKSTGGERNFTYTHSNGAKKKMSKAKRGKNNPNYGKYGANHQRSVPIIQLDIQTGSIIGEFSNIREASDFTKVDKNHISHVCSGKRKSAGGFGWKYKKT